MNMLRWYRKPKLNLNRVLILSVIGKKKRKAKFQDEVHYREWHGSTHQISGGQQDIEPPRDIRRHGVTGLPVVSGTPPKYTNATKSRHRDTSRLCLDLRHGGK